MLHIWPDEQGAEGKSSRSKDTSSSLCWNTHRCCSQTQAQWSSCDPDRRQTHHATEVLVQNLHKVVNQFVHRQLVLWRQERCKVYCNEFGSYFMLGLICLILWVELLRCLCLNAFHNNFRMFYINSLVSARLQRTLCSIQLTASTRIWHLYFHTWPLTYKGQTILKYYF